MKLTDLFKINGLKMPVPDADVSVTYTDLDSEDSGRDEAGYMHRSVLRHKVATWSFEYSSLSESEKAYLEDLFGEAATFSFTHPSRKRSSESVTTTAYRSNYGISWHNAKTGEWRNYKFNIIEC